MHPDVIEHLRAKLETIDTALIDSDCGIDWDGARRGVKEALGALGGIHALPRLVGAENPVEAINTVLGVDRDAIVAILRDVDGPDWSKPVPFQAVKLLRDGFVKARREVSRYLIDTFHQRYRMRLGIDEAEAYVEWLLGLLSTPRGE